MKIRNKGRKIYKTKEKKYNGKNPAGKAFSVVLSILLIGGIGFLGYSVAEPIVNYTKKKGDNAVAENTNPTVSAVPTTEAATNDDGTAVETVKNTSLEQYRAIALTESDMTSLDSIKLALNKVPVNMDIEYIEIPLKLSGGSITYASSIERAVMSGAVKSSVTLSDIVTAVQTAGFKPVALISTFDDNIVPVTYHETGYITVDDGSQWIDDNAESGGKPWISPLSADGLSYLSDIVGEVSAAGFERVVCSDFIFPPFRESDLLMLDYQLSGDGRYMLLTSAANMLYDRAVSSGSTMDIEVSAVDVLKGDDDVISQPMMLSVDTVMVNVDIDEIGNGIVSDTTSYEFMGTAEDKTKRMLELLGDRLSGYSNVIVRISGSSVNSGELLKAADAAEEMGYDSYVIG